MSAQRAAKSGRDIVAYFAGHLANLANGNDTLSDGDEIVVVKPFHLYERVRRRVQNGCSRELGRAEQASAG